jgi:hypothetical protein
VVDPSPGAFTRCGGISSQTEDSGFGVQHFDRTRTRRTAAARLSSLQSPLPSLEPQVLTPSALTQSGHRLILDDRVLLQSGRGSTGRPWPTSGRTRSAPDWCGASERGHHSLSRTKLAKISNVPFSFLC